MKSLILITFSFFIFSLTSNAQQKQLNQIDKGIKGVGGTLDSVENMKKKTLDLGEKAGSLLGVKKKTGYMIKIPGISRAKIKELNAVIGKCPGVKDVDYVCDEVNQYITLNYKGPINDLLDTIEASTTLITDNNAKTLSDKTTILVTLSASQP